MRYPNGPVSTLGALIACDEMGASLERLRSLLDQVETYKKFSFYESCAELHLDLAISMEKCWREFESILEDLPE